MADGVAWFLGEHPERWVGGEIQAVAAYRVVYEFDREPWWRQALLGAVGLVLVVPTLVLFRSAAGLAALGAMLWVLWRALRHLTREPNDVIAVIADDRLVLLRAVSTWRRGWTIRSVVADWPIGQVRATTVGNRERLDLIGPGGEHLQLQPVSFQRGAAFAARLHASPAQSAEGPPRSHTAIESVVPEHLPATGRPLAAQEPSDLVLHGCQYVTGATIEGGQMVRPPGTVVTLVLNGWGLVAFVDHATFFRAPREDIRGVAIGGLDAPEEDRHGPVRWATLGVAMTDHRHVIFKVPDVLSGDLHSLTAPVTDTWFRAG